MAKPAQKFIESEGKCEFDGQTEGEVYEYMDKFLDRAPFSVAVARHVFRKTNPRTQVLEWHATLRWTRKIPLR